MSLLAQPSAAPVTVGGRKFSVIGNGRNLGLPQRSGYVAVLDVEAVELLFVLKVFDVPVAEGPARSDAPEPVIVSMELDEGAATILLRTDGGAKYAIDLGGLSVRRMD